MEEQKSFEVTVNDKGDIQVKQQNMTYDEMVGVLFRLTAQIKRQLSL